VLVRLVAGIAKRRRCWAPIELRRCQAQHGARSRRLATCAKGPGGADHRGPALSHAALSRRGLLLLPKRNPMRTRPGSPVAGPTAVPLLSPMGQPPDECGDNNHSCHHKAYPPGWPSHPMCELQGPVRAKASARRCTGALLYLMPDSLCPNQTSRRPPSDGQPGNSWSGQPHRVLSI
jgi:hypothetical protein